ncbi:MAG: hypothetical protein R2706_15930 [Acidimicrobiales bacterium]
MAKKTPTLDTPFRKGEKVVTTQVVHGIPEGANAKVKLVNGVGPWMRYWVRFDDGELVGHVDHNALVRPAQLDEWTERAERAKAAESSAVGAVSAGGDAPAAAGASGEASLIPEALLARSRAAKARLLG